MTTRTDTHSKQLALIVALAVLFLSIALASSCKGGTVSDAFLDSQYLVGGIRRGGVITEQFLDEVAWKESRGNRFAVGSRGELGAYQLRAIAVEHVNNKLGWRFDHKAAALNHGRAYARAYLILLEQQIIGALKRQPTQLEVYETYHLGFSRWLSGAQRNRERMEVAKPSQHGQGANSHGLSVRDNFALEYYAPRKTNHMIWGEWSPIPVGHAVEAQAVSARGVGAAALNARSTPQIVTPQNLGAGNNFKFLDGFDLTVWYAHKSNPTNIQRIAFGGGLRAGTFSDQTLHGWQIGVDRGTNPITFAQLTNRSGRFAFPNSNPSESPKSSHK